MNTMFQSKFTRFVLSLSIALMVLLGFSLYANFTIERPIKIVDLNTLSQEAVLAWAQENELKIEITEAYDETIPVGTVLSQSINVGERVFAGSTLSVTLSKGPSPDVVVDLMDFTGKDIGDVQTFIDANKLMNASILFEKSDKISSAYFIRQSIASGQIKRSDKIDFVISTGTKDTLTTVIVPDFTTYTKQQISSWGSSSNIKINFIEEFNNTIEAGQVFEQSLAANQSVYDGSSITIKLSLGTGVMLETLVGKSKTTIDDFINSNGLKVNYTYSYSSAQNKDFGMAMTPSAATRVGNGSTVNVTLSLGKINVSDFTNKTLKELEAWVADVNKKGANLKISSSTVYSDTVTSGNLIKQTPSSGDINPGTSITASVSKGGGITVKDFNTRTDTQEGLSIILAEKYSTSSTGTVISQSISAGTVVDKGTSITLTVSIGQVSISNYTGSSLSSLQGWINDVNGKGANLSLSSSESYNGSVSRGNIISQSPSSGSVNPGTSITASVSKGAGVTVNNFVGSSSTSQSGLSVSTSSTYSASIASGVVISQSIASGSVVDSGTSISLVVSAGVDPATLPVKVPYVSDVPYNITGNSLSVYKNEIATRFPSSLNLILSFEEYSDNNTSCGMVSRVTPSEGSTVNGGSTVTVRINTFGCN